VIFRSAFVRFFNDYAPNFNRPNSPLTSWHDACFLAKRRRTGGFVGRSDMRARSMIWTILAVAIAAGWCPHLQSLAAAQEQANTAADSSGLADAHSKGPDAKFLK